MRMAMPPSDFSGRSGRCGTHIWPSLNSGLPESISAFSASTVAVTPLVEASWPASSSVTSSPATGIRPAAARSRGSFEPPIDAPPPVRLSPTV
jgi:hypothetical protein